MTLLQAWGDSLTLLKPKNLKLFMLVTLKSVIDTYKLLLKYWWWLYVLICISTYGILNQNSWEMIVPAGWHSNFYELLLIFHFFLMSLGYFAICLATRPSVSQKNCAYFRSYMMHFIYIIFIDMMIFIFVYIFLSKNDAFWRLSFESQYGWVSMSRLLTMLFFLDSSPSIKNYIYSLFNSIKMIIFNAPLCLFVGLLVLSFIFFVRLLPVFGMYNYFVITLLMPMVICLFTNIYIKKLHDQFDLYFPQQ